MLERRLEELGRNLQGKKPHLPHFLSAIRLDGIRGFNNLRVPFDYPVSVIAGGNTTGKSTVLFATACAYKVPGAGVREFVPSTLFPDYRPKLGRHQDMQQTVTMEFYYQTPEGETSMRWRRTKGWNRSFFGRQNASQPERQVYLRTLSNLRNPSEVRGVLSMSRLKSEPPEETPLTASQIEFAHQMLPFRYSEVVSLVSGNKNLLFAAQEGGAAYSELHMAAGERAILRLSKEITQLDGALVLIDEVEAGLHPWVQQLLMLHLQQLALRNDLQIIVTSHSPVVLDSVPLNGRIFLDRDDASVEVVVRPAYRDLIQNALYGRSSEMLKLLCEDDIAEGILEGIFDFLLAKEGMNREAIRIGRDTGASQFPMPAETLRKFGQIQNTVFVLDGDQRNGEIAFKIQDAAKSTVSILFLPSSGAPESWVWDRLKYIPDAEIGRLGNTRSGLSNLMNQLDAIYSSASDSPSEIAKNKFQSLSESLRREASEICRIVARLEAGQRESDIRPLADELQGILRQWRE
ncbi:MAG: AAA family ATPase [Candidatus Poribacteria bacterium]|nr:AAA family ATPase [Candidatus Poribacteria bacterium]